MRPQGQGFPRVGRNRELLADSRFLATVGVATQPTGDSFVTDEPRDDLGELIRPLRTQIALSPDKLNVALVFDDQAKRRVTILLPRLAAENLQAQLREKLGSPPAPDASTTHKDQMN